MNGQDGLEGSHFRNLTSVPEEAYPPKSHKNGVLHERTYVSDRGGSRVLDAPASGGLQGGEFFELLIKCCKLEVSEVTGD